MKFLNEQGQEVSLRRAENLPGYEVTLAEDTVIDSAVNNPFFKGINVLQLPKKLKGFRDNPDLQKLLEPKILNTKITLVLDDGNFALFEPDLYLMTEKGLQSVNRVFGNGQKVEPRFDNFGLKNVKLKKGTIVGNIFII